MSLKAVVFDLWFTLITPDDFRPAGTRTFDAIPARLGFDPAHFGAFWSGSLPELYTSPKTLAAQVTEYAAALGRTLTPKDLALFDDVWAHHDQALASPRAPVLRALEVIRARGLAIGLLSNAHEREVRGWRTSPLASNFDASLFSCHLGRAKPDAEAYAAVLGALGVPAGDAVFVGDGGSGELAGARAAGFARVLHMRGFLTEFAPDPAALAEFAAQADEVVDGIGDLLTILNDPA